VLEFPAVNLPIDPASGDLLKMLDQR